MGVPINDETLTAYALNECVAADRARVEAAAKSDPSVAARIAALRQAAKASSMALSEHAEARLTDAQRAAVFEGARRGEPASPFDEPFDAGDVDIDIQVSQAPSTAAKGESSILFSLANLQALADDTGQVAKAKGAAHKGFGPGDEVSGLIDIRAMAGKIDIDDERAIDDDFLGIGQGSFAAMGAPVMPVSRRVAGHFTKIAIGAGAVVAVACAVLIVVLATRGEDDDGASTDERIAMLVEQIAALEKAGGGEAGRMEELARQLEAAEAAKEEATAEKGDVADEVAAKRPATKAKDKAPASAKSAGAAASEPKATAKASDTGSSGSTATKGGKKIDELDDLLGGSAKAPPKKAEQGKAASGGGGGGLPDTLSRDQVKSGMNAVAGSVKQCGHGQGGNVLMDVTILGSGTVSAASATGAHAGTALGACAARAVKRAKFPRFKNPNLKVKYPFAL